MERIYVSQVRDHLSFGFRRDLLNLAQRAIGNHDDGIALQTVTDPAEANLVGGYDAVDVLESVLRSVQEVRLDPVEQSSA